ncbi:MAG TPA: phage tail sheath subtilisin-like domain-containing protein [Kofleriaceae bacterium]|nr:phage tail sheath subtilisin-like domain-containing protein [Kofleriaceae bacterium]
MPVTLSYPGIYIEELPSSAHTITAAPTSIAVFIGYTHPYKTRKFGEAVRVFNFTDYERQFGGLYANGRVDNSVAYAVQQFFLNGGSDAYVIGIEPKLHSPTVGDLPVPIGDIGNIRFTGLEPVDGGHLMAVSATNINATSDAADLTITYGSRAETFRNVSLIKDLSPGKANPNFIETRINGADGAGVSSLVRVGLKPPAASYGTYPAAPGNTASIVETPTPAPGAFVTNYPDFASVFATDSSLDKVDIFNLMVIPGVSDAGVLSQALAFCEHKRAFLIVDPPVNDSADGAGGLTKIEDDVDGIPKSTNGALYFPYLTSIDTLTGDTIALPPSGYVAGIYARTDNNRGVWKAPAGLETTVLNATGVVSSGRLSDSRAGVLNPLGVNCLRTFPGVGTVVFGARTLVTSNPAFEQWRYVPVRRTALFIEQTLLRNLGWVVFEPNDEPLWLAIRTSIEAFMLSLFHQGAFQGSTPSAAFQVKCDSSTTTQTDIDLGIVNILVGFRPLKPAEFVVIKIAQLAGQAQT